MTVKNEAVSREANDRRARRAAQRLVEALRLAEVTLPSLRPGYAFANFPHVELGGVHAEQVERLADWIETHADRSKGQ